MSLLIFPEGIGGFIIVNKVVIDSKFVSIFTHSTNFFSNHASVEVQQLSTAMRRGDFDKVKRSDVSDNLALNIQSDLHLWLKEARSEWKRVGSPFAVPNGSSFTCDLCGAKLKKVYKVENK